VVTEVTQCLHDLSPCFGVVDPSSITIELLVVLNKWFAKLLLPRVLGTLFKGPYGRNVNFDGFADYVEDIEPIDNLQRFTNSFDIESEVVFLKDDASLEPLDDTWLAPARA
jgi:hypothetical protein